MATWDLERQGNVGNEIVCVPLLGCLPGPGAVVRLALAGRLDRTRDHGRRRAARGETWDARGFIRRDGRGDELGARGDDLGTEFEGGTTWAEGRLQHWPGGSPHTVPTMSGGRGTVRAYDLVDRLKGSEGRFG